MNRRPSVFVLALPLAALALASGHPGNGTASTTAGLFQVDHVADGDTITLTNGQRVRLVQIDTPEVYSHPECYGAQASQATKQLLPAGTLVRLAGDPTTDQVDRYGRLLRYVIRVRGNVNANLWLVAHGAAAPYFYNGGRGIYAARLETLARTARAQHLGLWGACPATPYNPIRGVSTGNP